MWSSRTFAAFSTKVSHEWTLKFFDDFLACFPYKEDAEHFRSQLTVRLAQFSLEVAEEKTRCIEFGRFARANARKRGEKPEAFTFLGFTHYCGKNRKGKFRLKRRTRRKKFAQSLREFTEWARKMHQFTKKTKKTPLKELALARRRMKEVKDADTQRT